jgi:2-phosphoglycolate phosphatase
MSTADIRTILFDLDGTLLDTAPDLAVALNTVLAENQRAVLPLESIRPAVSHGGMALIKLGFNLEQDDPRVESLRHRLLAVYSENISRHTTLFPGMETVLQDIEQRGLNWGIVTNKPGWLTAPLLKNLQLYDRAACVVSGDTLPHSKPHPAPLLHACKLAGTSPGQCLYVGDAQRDIEAGESAGMMTMIALFGYFTKLDQPHTWGATHMINNPEELLAWLDGACPQ